MVRQLHQVIVRSSSKCFGFGDRFLTRAQHNQRCVFCGLLLPVLRHQVQSVDLGHHQILQDDRRFQFRRAGKCFLRIGAEVKGNVLVRRQHSPNGLADNGLVVHEQHHDVLLKLMLNRLQVESCVGHFRFPLYRFNGLADGRSDFM